MGSGSLMAKTYEFGEEVEKIRIQNFEIGAGFINTRISKAFLFEIFTGTGYIAQQHNNIEPDKTRTLEIHSLKYFLQPNIALKKNNFFSLAFSLKLVWVENNKVNHNFESLEYNFLENPGVMYFEPTLDMRVGRLVKFRLQMKYVHALEKPVPYYSNVIISMGFQAELDELFSEKEKPDEQKDVIEQEKIRI